MRAVDLIRKKRDGGRLDRDDIDFFIHGVTDRSLPDYQASALLMAILLRGMDEQETAWLTAAMVASGDRLDLSAIPGPKVDKHSTGGVGDKTSLVLGPVAAACGVIVPMMSGRGLGHTGGTLDKIEAIPGFRVDLGSSELRAALDGAGWVLVGQTAEVAPADKVLYALRDVTATVESLPLITASIMSKKIAEGIDGLVLDVKAGRGAFMKTIPEAMALARSMVSVGKAAGVKSKALITSMDAPLGRAVGNAIEVVEALDTLHGRGPADLEALSLRLAAEMVLAAGVAATPREAEASARAALASGAALEQFRRTVVRQGGDARVVDDPGRLAGGTDRYVVAADGEGYLVQLDAELIGRSASALGAGRTRVGESIDHAVGILIAASPGERVEKGQPILELLYRDERRLAEAQPLASRAIRLAEMPPDTGPLVLGEVGDGTG